jgi:PKD repeat protein
VPVFLGSVGILLLLLFLLLPGNQPPVALATTEQISRLSFGFSSEDSYDPDGVILSYLWQFGDGFTSTEPNPVYTYKEAGSYSVGLTVTDDKGAIGEDTEYVEVLPLTNEPPIAVASINFIEGLTVSFIGEGSYDPDGEIVSYLWDFGDGTSSIEMNPTHTYPNGGEYTVVLSVVDNIGAVGREAIGTGQIQPLLTLPTTIPTFTFPIITNESPVANFVWEVSDVGMVQYHFYDRSEDLDSNIISWHWIFGDGGESVEQNPYHNFKHNGDWIVTLTVTDQFGETSSISKTVHVTEVVE